MQALNHLPAASKPTHKKPYTPKDVIDTIARARTSLLVQSPFFGTIALHLKVLIDETCDTMWTDGANIGCNPWFVLSTPFVELKGVFAHEVMHVANLHHLRANGRDHDGWNIACDYAINGVLVDAGFQLPKDALVYDPWKGLSAEEIYEKLPKNGKGQKTGKNGQGNSSAGQVRQGSTAKNPGTVTQVDVHKAAAVAKAQGKLPADLEKFLDNSMKPIANWKRELWEFLTPSKDEVSWRRLNRKMFQQEIYMPTLSDGVQAGVFAFVLDTSGSLWDTEWISQFISEVQSVMTEVKPEAVYVIQCDARVHRVDTFKRDEDILIDKAKGGGGTDFRPPFEWLETHGIVPEALVYLTDMMGTFPGARPPFPVLWATTERGMKAPFGRLVNLV